MKRIRTCKKIIPILLSAMVMTCNALSFQAPISTAAAERAALAESAVPFGTVDGLETDSYSPDKINVLLKQAYSRKYDRLLKKIFSDPMFKHYEVLSDPETANPKNFRLFVAVDLNNSGDTALREALDYLRSFDEIYYAGPNELFEIELQWSPEDPGTTAGGTMNYSGCAITSEPAYKLIDLYRAWDITTGSPNFVIGNAERLYYNHEDLIGQMWVNPNPTTSELHGFNFTNNNVNGGSVYIDQPGEQHGTLTGSIMCAAGMNRKGSAGVAYGCKLMATMGNGSAIAEDSREFYQVINYLNQNAIRVYNISLGFGDTMQIPVLSAIQEFNGLCVVSASNEGMNIDENPYYPPSYATETDNLIAVGGVDNQGNNLYNYGVNTVQIAAPSHVVGCGYEKPNPDVELEDTYWIGDGTSSSSPVVAGVIALIWSANPAMTPQEVKECLLRSAEHVETLDGKIQGGRLVNAYNALLDASCDKGYYFFRSKANGGYLDLAAGNYNTLITYDFNGGENQKFHFYRGLLSSEYNDKFVSCGAEDNGGYKATVSDDVSGISVAKDPHEKGYRILKSFRVARNGGEEVDLYALEVKNPNSPNSGVFWNKYQDSNDKQLWYAEDSEPADLEDGVYTIENRKSDRLMDVVGTSGSVIQYNSNGGNNQKWMLTKLDENGSYKLQTLSTAYPGYLNRSGSVSRIMNTPMTVKLYYTDKEKGWIRVHIPGSTWSMQVQDGSTSNYTPVVWGSCQNNRSDQWRFEPVN